MRNIDIFIFVFWMFHIEVGIVCLVREVHWCLWFIRFSKWGAALPLWCYCYCQCVTKIWLFFFFSSFTAGNSHRIICNGCMRLHRNIAMKIMSGCAYFLTFASDNAFFCSYGSSCTYLCLCGCSSFNPKPTDTVLWKPFPVTFHLLL